MTLLWLKAAHVTAALIWMAGMFSLIVGQHNSDARGLILRLNGWVITPAMIVAIGLGVTLAISGGWIAAGAIWLFLKVILVTIMIALHGFQSGTLVRAGISQEAPLAPRQATVMMWMLMIAAIVFLAEAKPL